MKLLPQLSLISVLVLLAIPAGAQPQEDLLGLYFDTTASLPCYEGVAGPTTITMYLILSNPRMPAVYGFECGITASNDAAVLMGYDHPCDVSVTPLQLDQILIICSAGFATSENTVLMSLDWLYVPTPSGLTLFDLGASTSSIVPGADSPVAFLGGGSNVPLNVNIFSNVQATAAISVDFDSYCYPLAADDHSWDAVKTLYR